MVEFTPTSRDAASAPIRTDGFKGYERTRAVEMRAAVTRYGEDDRTQAAFARLDSLLTSGRPPRRDVPPGFYLDVVL